jgi:hypothetical protein
MFNFTHSTQELNLVIQSLEHKIRDMTELLNKMVAQAQAQAPKPQVTDASTEVQS